MPKRPRTAAASEMDTSAAFRQRRGDRNESQTVLRACEVLKAFQYRGEELCLSDVTQRTGLPKTTAFRLLRTLIHGGLLERASAGVYRNSFRPISARPYRIGFASQGETPFAQQVERSIELACARENLQLVKVDNRYSAREALRNADLLIKEQVDLVLEFQTYERVAPVVAAKFLEANVPVIAIEVPHPGAAYFGANNYKAGLIAGRALGRWTREHWKYKLDQILLLELPIAGSLIELRITGFADGLRAEMPEAGNIPAIHLNGRGDFEQVLETMRQFLRRSRAKRTLVGTVNDICALAAIRAFEEVGATDKIAIASQNCLPEVRAELRRPGTPLVGSVAYFPELYGEEILPMALGILAKKSMAPAIFVKHQLVTPRNVDLIYPLDDRIAAASRVLTPLRTVA